MLMKIEVLLYMYLRREDDEGRELRVMPKMSMAYVA